MLMHDNVKPHVAQQHNLEEDGIRARSGLRLQVERYRLDLKLWRRLVRIWYELKQNERFPLILSMNRQCENFILGRGGTY